MSGFQIILDNYSMVPDMQRILLIRYLSPINHLHVRAISYFWESRRHLSPLPFHYIISKR